MKINIYFISLIMLIVLNSCIIVKEDDNTEIIQAHEGTTYTLTPKPIIPMSETYIRSEQGDMVSLIPKDWILLNIDNNTNPDIFAIAVNKDYTLSAVFSNVRHTSNLDDVYKSDGIIGVVNFTLNKKKQKTGGSLNIMGNIDFINIGPYKYAKFNSTHTGGVSYNQSVVFKSTLNNFFEFSLVPINVMGMETPTQKDIDDIFHSILSSVKY